MKVRTALVATLVVAAVAVVVLRGQLPSLRKVDVRQASAPVTEALQALPPLAADSGVTFEVLHERALTPYRLRPDRRLLLAIAEIRRLAGVRDSAVTVQFAAGRWALRCGSRDLGMLFELADFPEMLELVTELARAQAWGRGWADNGGRERPDLVRALDRLDAPGALREVDRAWATGSRDASLFRDAARAYGLLALETPKSAPTADLIAARGLATLAYARALGAENPRRESCLLAEALGYSETARELARQLPAKDPLRLYVTRDTERLERAAASILGLPASSAVTGSSAARSVSKPATANKRGVASKRTGRSGTAGATKATQAVKTAATAGTAADTASLEAPYFHLLLVANGGDEETWSSFARRLERPGVPSAMVIASGLRIESVEPRSRVAERLLKVMAPRPAPARKGSRSRASVVSDPSLAQRVRNGEAIVEAHVPKEGVFFDAEIARAHRRGLVYVALDAIAAWALERKSAAEITRWFATGSLKGVARRPAAFQRWYSHLASARVGRADRTALRADVDSLAPGSAQALRSYASLRARVAPDDPTLRDAARGLARRMDSRPEHRIELATIAERDLGALSLAERLETSAAVALGTSDSSRLPWKTLFQNDTTGTRPRHDIPDSVVGARLARKLATHPKAWEAAESYAIWLEEGGKYQAARRVVERWMVRTEGDSGAAPMKADARIQMARLLQLEGRPQQALQLMGELHRSGNFAAKERTSLILQDLGQRNQALAIAWAAHRGAPHLAEGPALLAELFWRQGRYSDAAKVLQDAPGRLAGSDWSRAVAPRFVVSFRGHDREGVKAAEALMKAGFTDRSTFGTIPQALGDEGLYPLAFELQSRMQLSGAAGFESAILAYGYLKRAKGEAAAIEWIRGRVEESNRDLLGILAWQEQVPELLWSMAPSRLQGDLGDYLWLLRTAACVTAGPSHPRYKETANHMGSARGSHHLEIARYLLDLRGESEILTMAQTLRQRSEIYYFAGLKAEQRRKLRDAAEWYFMSVEADTGDNIESRWALRRLRSWANEARRRDVATPGSPPPA